MRDILTTIDSLLSVVPATETPRARLVGLREDVTHTAPEVLEARWRDLEAIMVDLRSPYFGGTHPEWLTKAIEIWRDTDMQPLPKNVMRAVEEEMAVFNFWKNSDSTWSCYAHNPRIGGTEHIGKGKGNSFESALADLDFDLQCRYRVKDARISGGGRP